MHQTAFTSFSPSRLDRFALLSSPPPPHVCLHCASSSVTSVASSSSSCHEFCSSVSVYLHLVFFFLQDFFIALFIVYELGFFYLSMVFFHLWYFFFYLFIVDDI